MPSTNNDAPTPPCPDAEDVKHADDLPSTPVGAKTGRPAKRLVAEAPDPAQRKRRRRSALSWKWNRWALKGVSQMRLFVNWLRRHEYDPASLLLPISSAPTANSLFCVAPPLMLRDDRVHIVIKASPLPSVEAVVKGADLAREGATDVSSYESDGPLLCVNLQVAKFLVETRKSVRVELSGDASPIDDLALNPAVAQRLNDARFQQLSRRLTTQLMRICHDVSHHRVIIFVRLGLDVGDDERSLIVCSTGASSNEAKETARQIWKHALRLTLGSQDPVDEK